MSISYSVYFDAMKPLSREDIANRCRELNWTVLMRETTADSRTSNLVKPTGLLSHHDCFYGADSRRVSESELATAVMEKRWDVLGNTSGGEAIVSIDSEFDLDEAYDEDGLEELSENNAGVVARLKLAKVHIEFLGGAYFVLQLSDAVARIGGGVWEDPQSGDWEIYSND
jgi:hypothetical protein